VQHHSEILKARTTTEIARRGNVTGRTEVLIWVGFIPVNVEMEVGVRKTTVKSFMMMKE